MAAGRRKRFGEILVEAGACSEATLQGALQKRITKVLSRFTLRLMSFFPGGG